MLKVNAMAAIVSLDTLTSFTPADAIEDTKFFQTREMRLSLFPRSVKHFSMRGSRTVNTRWTFFRVHLGSILGNSSGCTMPFSLARLLFQALGAVSSKAPM